MRRLLSTLAHPAITLALLCLLLADAYLTSQPHLLSGFSTAGLSIREHILHQRPARVQSFSPTRAVLILQPSGEFTILHPDEDSTWDKVSDARRDHPVIMFNWRPISISRGLWAPTTRTERHKLEIEVSKTMTPDQRAAARRLFIEQSGAASWLSHTDFQTLTTTDIDRTRPIPLGYLHNTLAIAALLLFLVSLRWVPKTPAYIRARLGQSRLSRGLCPSCSYNLHGLREPTCPECGTPLGTPSQPAPGTAP